MKNLFLLLLIFSLCSCASQYVMKLTNGATISTPSKPKLKGSYYYFKDARGEQQVIPQSRVMEIEPESMAKEEKKKEEDKIKASQTKQKHWYWPF
jgi:uncharacterized radical SAM superfamily Fe-S cluster-containing enzyme